MEGKKANIHQVIRKVILHVRKQERNVSTTELDESWRLIEKQIHATKKKKLHQRLLYAATYSSVAAILLCMFWLGKQFISYYHADDSALVDFALKMQAAPLQEDILLLIPGEKNIEVSDTDANIIYSQNGLVVVNSDTVNQIQPQKKKPEFNQLITPKGKRTQLTLPDGTHLWVNSGTRVIYPTHFERDQREIYVEGEVFLDVRRNEIAAGDLHSLRDCPFVLGSAADIGGRIGRELLRASGISPISKATSENVETLLALCVQGVGACFCPENLLQTALSPEQLAQLHILPLCPSASYPICFGYLRRSYPWSVLSEFIRIAREQIRSV